MSYRFLQKGVSFRLAKLEVLCEAPRVLWNLTANHAGISRDFFFEYFSGRSTAFAIKIKAAERYNEPLDPYDMIVGFKAPQSFRYLENGKLLKKLMHPAFCVHNAYPQGR